MSGPIEIRRLDRGAELGSGGQATVYELPDRPDEVLKLYKPWISVDRSALEELIAWRERLPREDRLAVDATCAWPSQLVTRGPHAAGCVMPRVPPAFYASLTTGLVRLRELQYLIRPERASKLGIRVPQDPELSALCLAFARTFDVFDRHGVVYGDVSMRNLLWRLDPAPGVFFIDCDSARIGGRAALPDVLTRQWGDPNEPQAGPDIATDRYKLALLIGRALFGEPRLRPGAATPEFRAALPRLGTEISSLLARGISGAREGRPTAREWLIGLESRGSRDLFVGRHAAAPGKASRGSATVSRPALPVTPPRVSRRQSAGAVTATRPTTTVNPRRTATRRAATRRTPARSRATGTRPVIPVRATGPAMRPPVIPQRLPMVTRVVRAAAARPMTAVAVAAIAMVLFTLVFASVAQGVPPLRVAGHPPGLYGGVRQGVAPPAHPGGRRPAWPVASARCSNATGDDRPVTYISSGVPAPLPSKLSSLPPDDPNVRLVYDAGADVLDVVLGDSPRNDFDEYREDLFVMFDSDVRGRLLSVHARGVTRLRPAHWLNDASHVVGPSVWERTIALSRAGRSANETLTIPGAEWRILRDERWPAIHEEVRSLLRE